MPRKHDYMKTWLFLGLAYGILSKLDSRNVATKPLVNLFDIATEQIEESCLMLVKIGDMAVPAPLQQ